MSPTRHTPKIRVPKQGSGEEISCFLLKIPLFFRLLGHPKKLGGGQNLVYLSSRNLWNLRYPLLSPWFWTIFSWGPPHGFGIPPGKWPLFFRLLAQAILGSETPQNHPKMAVLSPFWEFALRGLNHDFRCFMEPYMMHYHNSNRHIESYAHKIKCCR